MVLNRQLTTTTIIITIYQLQAVKILTLLGFNSMILCSQVQHPWPNFVFYFTFTLRKCGISNRRLVGLEVCAVGKQAL